MFCVNYNVFVIRIVLQCTAFALFTRSLEVSLNFQSQKATFSNALLSYCVSLFDFALVRSLVLLPFSPLVIMYYHERRRLQSDERFGESKFGDRGGSRFGGDRFGGSSRRDDNLMADSDTEVGAEMANYTTIKNFYDPSKNPSNRSSEEIKHFMDKEQIIISGTSDAFLPMMDFADYAWPKQAVNIFRRNNYERPTPIQAICWPIALSGRDLIGIAVS